MDFRTDIVLERNDMYKKANNLEKIDGIETEEEIEDNAIYITRVKITNNRGEEAIGKPIRNVCNNRYKKLKNCNRSRDRKSSIMC